MPTFDDLEVDEACARVLDHLARRDASDRLEVEVEVEAAHGRVLATDIFATITWAASIAPLEDRTAPAR